MDRPPAVAEREPSCLSYWEGEDDSLAPLEARDVKLERARQGARVPTADPQWTFHGEQYRAWASKKRTKVVVAGRRWGKSEWAVRSVLSLARDYQLRGEDGVIWVVTPTLNMARPLWRKFIRTALPGWITHVSGSDKLPDMLCMGDVRLEFKSGDHPERLVGEGLIAVMIDECGIIKEKVYTESIMPALMDHSAPAFLTGTPKGKNWFYRLYIRGLDPLDPEVETFGGPSSQNPFMKPSETERLRAEMLPRLFRQEVLAQFLDDEGAVFRGIRDCIGPLSTNPTVAYGVDLARKTDYTVVFGIDADGRVTYFDRFHNILWPLQKDRLIARNEAHNGRRPKWVVDATGVGDPITQDLARAGLRVEPFVFTPRSKVELIDALAIAFEQKRIVIPEEPVVLNELESFEFEIMPGGNTRYSAPEGLHDDCVCALALAWKGIYRSGDPGVTIGEPEPTAVTPPEQFPLELLENPLWSDPDNWA